jgi:coenzyme F420-reducing hydrogenase delta subunit
MLYIIDLQDDLKSQNETIDNLRKELAIERERVRYLDEELALRDKQTELAVEMAKNVGGTDEV